MIVPPNIEDFEERAALAQFEGGLSRAEAEDVAAQDQGFISAIYYWRWLADYVNNRKLT